jgi:hypothetical protein
LKLSGFGGDPLVDSIKRLYPSADYPPYPAN